MFTFSCRKYNLGDSMTEFKLRCKIHKLYKVYQREWRCRHCKMRRNWTIIDYLIGKLVICDICDSKYIFTKNDTSEYKDPMCPACSIKGSSR